jgi:RNA polymerase sigma-70 factor (ECF subfamily)
MSEYLDEQLVQQYLSGDEKSLEILIQKYLKPIYNFVYRYVGDMANAEDLTQEVFVKVWKNIKKFDRKRNFKTWIFCIAKNTAFDYLRKKKSIPLSNFENDQGDNVLADSLADVAPLPSELFDKADISQKINTALNKLSLNYRAVILLRYKEDFKFIEIAEILDESIDTVKSRYRRGLRELRKFL